MCARFFLKNLFRQVTQIVLLEIVSPSYFARHLIALHFMLLNALNSYFHCSGNDAWCPADDVFFSNVYNKLCVVLGRWSARLKR